MASTGRVSTGGNSTGVLMVDDLVMDAFDAL